MVRELIDIQGLDKVELLRRLVRAFKRDRLMSYVDSLCVFDFKEAEKAVTQRIDYFQYLPIKMDLSGDVTDATCYDRGAGAGTAARVVKEMREEEAKDP